MVFAQPSIKEEDGVTQVVTSGYSDARTDQQRAKDNRLFATATVTTCSVVPGTVYFAGPWVLTATSDPVGEHPKRKGPKDSTHVPFYRNLPKFKRCR